MGASAEAWRAVLESIAARLSAASSALAEDARTRRVTRGRARSSGAAPWSPLEIAEHVALVDRYVLILVEKIAAKARTRAAGADLDAIDLSRFDHLELLASRDFRWEAPPHMRPTGLVDGYLVARTIEAQRDRALARLAEFPRGEGTLHRIRMSVVEGDDRLDLYQYVYVLLLHAERHVRQLRDTE